MVSIPPMAPVRTVDIVCCRVFRICRALDVGSAIVVSALVLGNSVEGPLEVGLVAPIFSEDTT